MLSWWNSEEEDADTSNQTILEAMSETREGIIPEAGTLSPFLQQVLPW